MVSKNVVRAPPLAGEKKMHLRCQWGGLHYTLLLNIDFGGERGGGPTVVAGNRPGNTRGIRDIGAFFFPSTVGCIQKCSQTTALARQETPGMRCECVPLCARNCIVFFDVRLLCKGLAWAGTYPINGNYENHENYENL